MPEDTPRLVPMLLGTLPSFEPGDEGWRRYVDLPLDALSTHEPMAVLSPPSPVRDHRPPL